MIPSVVIVTSDEQLRGSLYEYIVIGRKFSAKEVYSSGFELIDKLDTITPNVILIGDKLDISPYQLIIEIMERKPIPCLLVTLGVDENEIDYAYALEYGIVDTLQIQMKDGKLVHTNSINIRLNILSKLNIKRFYTQIRMINESQGRIFEAEIPEKVSKAQFIDFYPPTKDDAIVEVPIFSRSDRVKNVLVVIGASTGGPAVISALVSKLPKIFPPTIIIQHMPPGFMEAFAARLNEISEIRVKIAENQEVLKSNIVYVCPGGYHLVMDRGSDRMVRFRLNDGPKVNFVKPAVDVTLFSAARAFGSKVISVILSGMGSDGTEGCRVIKSMGGIVWTLNESESVIYGMNRSVVEKGLSDKTMSVNEMLKELDRTVYL